MEILFENRYVRNKTLIKDICWYLCFGRKIQIILQAVMGVLFVGTLLSAILDYTYNWFGLIGVPFYFVYKTIHYFLQVNRMMKRDQETFGEECFVETAVTEEGIQTVSSGGTNLQISFDKLRSVDQTKKLILVYTKANLIYVLPKDSFTKGTAEECLIFLKNHV